MGPNDERRRQEMKKMLTLSLAALMSAATLGVVTPAAAQQGYYDRDGYSSYYAGYDRDDRRRSEEHTSELQSLMRISYAVFCLKKKNKKNHIHPKQVRRHTDTMKIEIPKH